MSNLVDYIPAGDPVFEGREAWERIKIGVKMLREDWLKVGAALRIGRLEHPDNQGFGQWCKDNGFGDINRRLRADAIWLAEHQDAVVRNADNETANRPDHIRTAYRKLQKQPPDDVADVNHDGGREGGEQKPTSSGVGIRHAIDAINSLKKIPASDGQRPDALSMVQNWIDENR